jgi:ligand-binding sensor domain-containing protein/two-component sensor histidine kinase
MNGREFSFDMRSLQDEPMHYRAVNGYNRSNGEIWIDYGKFILSFSEDTVKVIQEFKTKGLALYSINEKEFFVGGSNGAFLLNSINEIEKKFLNNLAVTCVIKDREGAYWFSTLSQGVFYTRDLEVEVVNMGTDSRISGIIRNDQDQLTAIGYYGDIYTESNDGFEKIYDSPYNKSEYLRTYFDDDGFVVVEMDQLRMTLANGEFVKENREHEYHRLNDTYEARVSYYRVEVNKIGDRENFTIYNIPNKLKHSREYRYDNTLYIPTVGGLFQFDLHNKLVFLGDQYKELANRVNIVRMDDKQRLWIATNESGIYVLDQKRLISINKYNKRIGNICRKMIINGGFVWGSTESGLVKIDMSDYSNSEVYSTENGLLSNGICSLYADGQKIIVGHDGGITKFPVNYSKNNVAPLIHIDAVRINNELQTIKKSYSLDYNQGHLKINFTGISYSSDLHYKYRLKGNSNSHWIYTSDRNVEFISIPSGEYTFEVVAINSDGIASEPSSMNFTISPAFWKTWWFYSICTVLLGIITYLIIHFRIKKMKDKLEIERKLIDIEQQALRARMNPHFIFNSLNSIQAYVLSNDKRSANKYLSQFSNLMRSILENSEMKLIPIAKELETLTAYMQIESLRFAGRFKFEINVAASIDTDKLNIPPLLMQPYVENAIWHGILNKTEIGTIRIHLIDDEDHIICIVEDDGVGRETAEHIKKAKGETHESSGLKITANRMDLIKQLYGLDFSVEIIDLKRGNISMGTRVEIKLPHLKE